ncbi:YbaN family protein [Parendozoicomonas sp. Alg238-R29]|uniref:YbaN family protein n=1 Tax=Parendozoicomonas sp. Alg238-R29 TaxID=2993446 RepID=UPI00248E4A8B|nr:YbaN family protein [Parendozoicomonas sp. Alg238-R29]
MSETPPNLRLIRRSLYVLGGIMSLIAGLIGIVLPILPTTPFILLSAWCFARSSKSFHTWLITHPYFGEVISNWEKYRGMTKKNKKRAYCVVLLGAAFSLYTVPVIWVKLLLVPVFIAVLWNIYRMNTVAES